MLDFLKNNWIYLVLGIGAASIVIIIENLIARVDSNIIVLALTQLFPNNEVAYTIIIQIPLLLTQGDYAQIIERLTALAHMLPGDNQELISFLNSLRYDDRFP